MDNKDIKHSTESIRNVISSQFDICWQLLEIHLTGLEDEECLWRPCVKGLHIYNNAGV
ncbi:hypothetical protein J2TS4_28370 [Paenibacillus sp. J2TS4]|nr:hypothetical protein J2TS4_28370 [Paenibacillus sp. J2TS4]